MVEQPVEDGAGQGGIVVEDLRTVFEYAIRGDYVESRVNIRAA